MQQTLVAVFDNRNDAQQALEDLVSSGFSRSQARLSDGDPAGDTSMSSGSMSSSSMSSSGSSTTTQSDSGDTGFGSGIKNFFSDLFGADRSEPAQMYSQAVTRGHYVLTLTADSLPEVERAADIVERYGPVDIDEHSEQWGMGAGGSGLGATGGAGLGAMQQSQASQQSQPMSQQFAGTQDSSISGGTQIPPGGGMQDSSIGGAQSYQGGQRSDTTAIPVIQEELVVGKRAVERGGVRIYQRVVETPVNESIGLREEHVNVERHAVNRPIDPADVSAFQETTIELRETSEEAVVGKTARVVEEVVVGKEVTQRTEQVSDTVRRTEVEIEQLGGADDTYYRGHYTSNFADQGGTYDDYAPAYKYGGTIASNDQYRGKQWNDIEPNLRSDWETRNPGSTWEKMKSAVRHGWERVKS